MRVLLCDDHRLLVESVAVVFEGRGHTVDESLSPGAAAEWLMGHDADVCVLDLGFPKHDVEDPVTEVLRASPTTKIVVFTGSAERRVLERAREAGALGYVSKDDSVSWLVEVVERVGHDPAGAAATWDARPLPSPPAEREPHFLTPGELQALEGLVQGRNTTELARWMGVRESTVSTHIQTVLTKLGVHSRLEAVAYAMAKRLVAIDH